MVKGRAERICCADIHLSVDLPDDLTQIISFFLQTADVGVHTWSQWPTFV